MKAKKKESPTTPASDIVARLKLAAGNQDCPRDIRELMKDAVDAIKNLRERVRFQGRGGLFAFSRKGNIE